MNSTSRSAAAGFQTLVCVTLLTLGSDPLAQRSEAETYESLTARITQLEETLKSLDEQARVCLDTAPSGELPNPACKALLDAIDGEEIATYLQHCQSLRSWREQFVNDYQQANPADSADDASRLQLMVQTEYYCAGDALARRTDYVAVAFAALNSNRTDSRLRGDSPARSPSSTRIETQRMNERLRRETGQQWRSLELELLRQRLENP